MTEQAGKPGAEAKRSKPPSRSRYAASHRAVAVHLDLASYQRLLELRDKSKLSLGEIVRQALGLTEDQLDKARMLGFGEGVEQGYRAGFAGGRQQGFAEARQRYAISHPCSSCGKPITISTDGARKWVAKAMVDAGWHHGQCPRS